MFEGDQDRSDKDPSTSDFNFVTGLEKTHGGRNFAGSCMFLAFVKNIGSLLHRKHDRYEQFLQFSHEKILFSRCMQENWDFSA